ncbi:hypothetical protein, partial [Streptomyces sp. NPDC007000]|uniref:hypothetical protein n=1 Tax=Streptomyces sp. NPDC007000 TaxID=3155357 RepID=UPI00340A2823
IASVRRALEENGALEYTTIVAALAHDERGRSPVRASPASRSHRPDTASAGPCPGRPVHRPPRSPAAR